MPRRLRRLGMTTFGVFQQAVRTTWKVLWWWIRQVSGDAAYENYLRLERRRARKEPRGPGADECHPAPGRVLSPAEFYLDSLRRRYSGVSRCC